MQNMGLETHARYHLLSYFENVHTCARKSSLQRFARSHRGSPWKINFTKVSYSTCSKPAFIFYYQQRLQQPTLLPDKLCKPVIYYCTSRDNSPSNWEINDTIRQISEQLRNNGSELTRRNKMIYRRKLAILQEYGCKMCKVKDNLDVLELSEKEIKDQGEKLKSAYIMLITPELFLARDLNVLRLAAVGFDQLKVLKGYGSKLEYLLEKLECRSAEELKKTFPFIQNYHQNAYCTLHFGAHLEILEQHGFSIDDLKEDPSILKTTGFKSLRYRIQLIKEKFPYMYLDRRLIEEICVTQRHLLARKLQFRTKYRVIFDGCVTIDDVAQNISNIRQLIRTQTGQSLITDLLKLEEVVEYLQILRFSLTCIAENTFCLSLSLRNLKKTIEVVVEENGILPQVEFMSKIVQAIFKQKYVARLSPKYEYKISKKLEMPRNEMKDIAPKKKTYSKFEKLVDFLLEEGYSKEEIKDSPKILEMSLYDVKRRLQKCREYIPSGKPYLNVLAGSLDSFCVTVRTLKKYNYSKIKAVSEMLNIPPDQFELLDPILLVSEKDVKARVKYLLKLGISRESIVNDVYCLRIPVKSLREAVQQLRKDGNKITLMQITSIASKKMVEPKGVYNTVKFVQDQLKVPKVDRVGFWKERFENEHWGNSFLDIGKNIKILQDYNFTLENLQNCPYIVGHSNEILEEHLVQLAEMEKLPIYKDIFKDQIKLINFLQYNIEKNHNFIPIVNDKVLEMDDKVKGIIYKEIK